MISTSGIHLGIAEQLIGLGTMLAGAFVIAPKQDAMGTSEPVSSGRQVAGTVRARAHETAAVGMEDDGRRSLEQDHRAEERGDVTAYLEPTREDLVDRAVG